MVFGADLDLNYDSCEEGDGQFALHDRTYESGDNE